MKEIGKTIDKIAALEDISNEGVWEELYDFFKQIAALNKNECLAAFMALKFYEKHLPEPTGEYTKDLIKEAKEMLGNRIAVICQEAPEKERGSMVKMFSTLMVGCGIGSKCYAFVRPY